MKNLNNYKIENKNILFRADLTVPLTNNIITNIIRIIKNVLLLNKLFILFIIIINIFYNLVIILKI